MGLQVIDRSVAEYRQIWAVNHRLGVLEEVFWETHANNDAVMQLRALEHSGGSVSGEARRWRVIDLNQLLELPLREGIAKVILADAPWWCWFGGRTNAKIYLGEISTFDADEDGFQFGLAGAFDRWLKQHHPRCYIRIVKGV